MAKMGSGSLNIFLHWYFKYVRDKSGVDTDILLAMWRHLGEKQTPGLQVLCI